MANPERDTGYTHDGNRTVYTRESNGTGWFVGIIVALALLAIGYLVFSANTGPTTNVDVTQPGLEAPMTAPSTAPEPAIEAPAPATAPEVAPMTEAPAPAPAIEPAPAGEVTTTPAPASGV